MRIAILAALPSELKPLVKGWVREQRSEPHLKVWRRHDGDGSELIAVCAGMGRVAATRAFQAAEAFGSLDLVLSIGLAGATGIAGRLGEVSVLSEVIDTSTGERFVLTDGKRRLTIASSDRVANPGEKRRLAATYAAVLVDMEAATIARLAAMRGLPMCCIKAVSDEADATLPDINRFIDGNGQMQMAAFLCYVAVRPRFWPALISLGQGSARGATALAKSLQRFLVHKDWDYTNRTGDV